MTWGTRARRSSRRAVDWWLNWSGTTFSLGFKLLVPMVVLTVAVAGTMGFTVTNSIRNQIEGAYAHEAEDVAGGAEAIYAEDPSDISEINGFLVRVDREDPGIQSIRIVGLDAYTTVLASNDPTEVGKTGLVSPVEQLAAWRGQELRVQSDAGTTEGIYPIKLDGRLAGAVMIKTSTAAETASIRNVTLTIGVAALISVLVESVLLVVVFYANILRRTRRMQAAVQAVARGDYSVRIPEGQERAGRDEIFNLARSVDLMIANLDERSRGDALIRDLGRKALEGVASRTFVADALAATRSALGLESAIFATFTEKGVLTTWVDDKNVERDGTSLPVWVSGLTKVALEARRAVLTDRLGQRSHFAEEMNLSTAQAVIVPLPRLTKAGYAIVAIAPAGETIQDGGLAVLDAVAATIAETLHMQAAEEARAESAVKSKVMAAVSHEMRNPLNAILGFTGLVLNESNTNLTHKQRRQLGYVQNSASMMLTLVNNYLDLAKVRSGALTIQAQRLNVSQVVADIAATLQPMAAAKQIEIRTSITNQFDVRLDGMRIRQILMNLVSNSIKFTPEHGRVLVRARVDRDVCRLAVSDTGVGIPKEQRGLVFAEFAKIDAGAMAASKGSGLGLALTRAFVDAMGGSINFYSRQGRGTTFVVKLPADMTKTEKAA